MGHFRSKNRNFQNLSPDPEAKALQSVYALVYSLLTARNTSILYEYFKMLDFRDNGKLDDVQFFHWMEEVSKFNRVNVETIYGMLDGDNNGYIEFEQFYLIVCILIALKDKQAKEFIARHSRLVFDLIDDDGSGNISVDEFKEYGFLFGLDDNNIRETFGEYDISGDKELDYAEFQMFTYACIETQKAQEQRRKDAIHHAKKRQQQRLFSNSKGVMKSIWRFIYKYTLNDYSNISKTGFVDYDES